MQSKFSVLRVCKPSLCMGTSYWVRKVNLPTPPVLNRHVHLGMCIAIMVAVDASEKEALASGTQKCRPITIITSQLYTWGFPLKLNAMSLSSSLCTACSGQ